MSDTLGSFRSASDYREEALLPPTDRATRDISRSLMHNTVRTSCITNPQQIEVMKLEGYS